VRFIEEDGRGLKDYQVYSLVISQEKETRARNKEDEYERFGLDVEFRDS
jgi:hypothetical protein